MKNWPHCPTPKKIRLEVPGIVGLTLDWWLPTKSEGRVVIRVDDLRLEERVTAPLRGQAGGLRPLAWPLNGWFGPKIATPAALQIPRNKNLPL